MNLILSIAIIHLLACLSPGPDIFLVVRTSIRHGWPKGWMTTLGILSGVTFQIALGLTGVTYLVSQSALLHDSIALAGGGWLFYLGFKGLRMQIQTPGGFREKGLSSCNSLSPLRAWSEGLLVNLLNPKALLFFLSLFSIMLGPEIPLGIRVICGVTMITVQAIAFSLVAILVSQPFLNSNWQILQFWLDRIISLILLALGIWIWIKIILSHMG